MKSNLEKIEAIRSILDLIEKSFIASEKITSNEYTLGKLEIERSLSNLINGVLVTLNQELPEVKNTLEKIQLSFTQDTTVC